MGRQTENQQETLKNYNYNTNNTKERVCIRTAYQGSLARAQGIREAPRESDS